MEHGCVLFLRGAAADPPFRSFPNRAAGAAEPPAKPFRGGRGIGSRARGLRIGGLLGGSRRRGARTDRARRWTKRLCRRRDGRPITGVSDNSPHSLEPPIGATGTAPASDRGFKPRLVLEAQLQLATDHGSPFSLPGGRARGTVLVQVGHSGAGRPLHLDARPGLGIRD